MVVVRWRYLSCLRWNSAWVGCAMVVGVGVSCVGWLEGVGGCGRRNEAASAVLVSRSLRGSC